MAQKVRIVALAFLEGFKIKNRRFLKKWRNRIVTPMDFNTFCTHRDNIRKTIDELTQKLCDMESELFWKTGASTKPTSYLGKRVLALDSDDEDESIPPPLKEDEKKCEEPTKKKTKYTPNIYIRKKSYFGESGDETEIKIVASMGEECMAAVLQGGLVVANDMEANDEESIR